MTINRMAITLALTLLVGLFAVPAASAQEAGAFDGHYSGPMDVEGHSAVRVNDGTGTHVLLEELDQTTIHNVLRQATRPEAADIVRRAWEEDDKARAAAAAAAAPAAAPEAPPSRANVGAIIPDSGEEYVTEDEGVGRVPLQQSLETLPHNPRLVRGHGPQLMPGMQGF